MQANGQKYKSKAKYLDRSYLNSFEAFENHESNIVNKKDCAQRENHVPWEYRITT